MPSAPSHLRRAPGLIQGKTIYMRLAVEADARQILKWRTNPELSLYLSPVDDSLEKQEAFLRAYKKREAAGEEFYYIICRHDNLPVGCVRIYDFNCAGAGTSSWGGWLLDANKPAYAAVESAMLVYRIGFEHLKLNKFVFQVDARNEKTLDFHRRIKSRYLYSKERATLLRMEDWFCFDRAAYESARTTLQKFIE